MSEKRESQPAATQLWGNRLIARDQVEAVYGTLGSNHFSHQWAGQPEAAVLTLGTILSRAVRRRLKAVTAPPMTATQEYRDILNLSKEFDERLASLQERDDPPPRLPRGRSGRTHWESWALGVDLGQPRGAKRKTDRILLSRLLAYYQLSSGTDEQFVVPNSDLSTLYAFLEASFGCARLEFRRRVEDEHLQRSQLMPPSPAMLEKARNRKKEMAAGFKQVRALFEKVKTRLEAAGLELAPGDKHLSGD